MPLNTNKLKARLEVHSIQCKVHLGCGAEERAQPQEVAWDIKVFFNELPPACNDDQLEHTVCYAKMAEILEKICAAQPYALIERLGAEGFRAIRSTLPNNTQLELAVKKLHPPVASIRGGSHFVLSECSS